MMTQREPKGEHRTFLLPPVSLEFTISQEHKNRCLLRVSVYSGMHCFCVRELEVFYDTFGELPVVVTNAQMQWLLWLARFEAARRGIPRGTQSRPPVQMPDWPSPDRKVQQIVDVEF
jgi:hypothetical protein